MLSKWGTAAAVAIVAVLTAGPAAAQTGPSAGPVLPDAPSEQVKKPQQLDGENVQPPEGATADVALKVLRDGTLQVTEKVTVPGGKQLISRVPLKSRPVTTRTASSKPVTSRPKAPPPAS